MQIDNQRVSPGQRGRIPTIYPTTSTIVNEKIPLNLTGTNSNNIPVVDLRQLPGTFENNVRNQGPLSKNKIIINGGDVIAQNVIVQPIKPKKTQYCFLYNLLYVLFILLILSIILILLGIFD